jgi:hypothetical protein
LGKARVKLNLVDDRDDLDLGQQDVEILDTEV